MLHFHIVTLFPESIEPYLKSSIVGRAREKRLIKISFYDPKDFTRDKYERVDRRPYGGGPGMVLEPDAVLRAAQKAVGKKRGVEKIFFATDGAQFDEAMAKKLSRKKDILLISGRYEGVDARVQKILKAKPVSVGPYVLTGGELPAAFWGKQSRSNAPASRVRKSTRARKYSRGRAKSIGCRRFSYQAIVRKSRNGRPNQGNLDNPQYTATLIEVWTGRRNMTL